MPGGQASIPPFEMSTIRPSVPLRQATRGDLLLEAYRDAPIPPESVIVLKTHVFDGIGDLDHAVHAATHFAALREREPFARLIVVLSRGSGVPEDAWRTKIAHLTSLGVEVFIKGSSQSDPEEFKRCRAFLARLPELHACVIGISHSTQERHIEEPGFISEYGNPQPHDSLTTGLCLGTAGAWIKDDPAFAMVPPPPGDNLKSLLFGAGLTEHRIKSSWDVGAASLRTDDARMAYLDLRLRQVPSDRHCAIAMSPFSDSSKAHSALQRSMGSTGFDRCVIVNRDGTETVLIAEPPAPSSHMVAGEPRTLRLIHQFIAEEDYYALQGLSRSGSMGGAGDTATMRGLAGAHPVFIEYRDATQRRILCASEYLAVCGYDHLAQWYQACGHGQYALLASLAQSPELLTEWHDFRHRAMEELDIGPTVDLYARRCAWVAKTGGFASPLVDAETKFLGGESKALDYYRCVLTHTLSPAT